MSHSTTGGQRPSATWRRRLLRVLRPFGVQVVDIAPGTVVATRSRAYDSREMGPNTVLLRRRGRRRTKVRRIDDDLVLLVDRDRRGRTGHRALTGDLWLLGDLGDENTAVTSRRLDGDNWLVGDTRSNGGTARVRARLTSTDVVVGTGTDDLDVDRIDGRTWLVTRRQGAHEPLIETHVSKRLGERHVAWLLETLDIDCVLDVGANVGQFGRALRANGFDGHIVSFEPVPQFADEADRSAAKDARWTVRRTALGTRAGDAQIRVQRSFSSLLDTSDYGKERFATLRDYADTEPITIPIARLDDVLEDVVAELAAAGVDRPRFYLKMDTQGFDVEVFNGLGSRVSDILAMQSEVAVRSIYDGMPSMSDSLEVYGNAGFEVTGLYPVTREPDGRVIEYDAVLVRPGAEARAGAGSAAGDVLF